MALKWEGKQVQKEEKSAQWGQTSAQATTKEERSGEGNPVNRTASDAPQSDAISARVACDICGFFNHSTKDCRRNCCEICGFNNHSTFDCKRCLSWYVGPELCAAQVEDQSFFYIEECID